MNVTFKPWGRRLAWALPMFALLAGCDAGKDTDKEVAQEPTKPHAVATYVSAPWEALPSVSDSDLLAGFESWRSACQRLKADPIWGPTCATAASVPGDAVAVRSFLKEHLDVFGLRSANNTPNGLITGYYEPVYPGSLTKTATAHVPVYGVPDDLIVVNLESIYPELKGKRLRGRLEGRVLKPYDDASTLNSQGSTAKPIAWLTDPMDLQFLQIQGSGVFNWPAGVNCVWVTATRTATRTALLAVGWWNKAN